MDTIVHMDKCLEKNTRMYQRKEYRLERLYSLLVFRRNEKRPKSSLGIRWMRTSAVGRGSLRWYQPNAQHINTTDVQQRRRYKPCHATITYVSSVNDTDIHSMETRPNTGTKDTV